ncbi:MAG: S41 family peptidase [Holophagaceae bacterium]|nr:S41 family peptidase [Holophagaceae bacterium]
MTKWLSRNWLWIVILCTIAVYAPLVGNSQDERAKRKGLDALTEIMELIQKQTIDPPNPKQVAFASIQGMLHTLDPHSNFMDEQEFRNMRNDQKGAFFGIGSMIQSQPDGVVIISTTPGGPAEKAGLRAGDYFREIDGKSTEGMSSNQVMRRLRGDKGTTVVLTMERPGVEQTFNVPITRAEIPSSSVNYSFMLTKDIGFIRIREFGETTSEEFARSINELKNQGLRALILDLRYNPGGILESAVGISNQLLGPNELVLTQKGKEGRDPIVYRTDSEPRKNINTFPVVVLINRGSASASEIVAGAIQDHDRGLLVGETSWGKGLVQHVMAINRTRGLSLTVARYYTPSGRCIQRDYQHGLDDYYIVDDDDETENINSARQEFTTSLGRVVHGGGGIRPDYIVKPKLYNILALRLLTINGAYFKFANAEKYAGRVIKQGQEVDDPTLQKFKTWLGAQKINISDSEWETAKSDIKERLTIDMQTVGHDVDTSFKYECLIDPQVQKAIELLPEAEKLYKRKLALKSN